MNTPGHAWHYTTAEGLIGIVSRNRLWATSAAYMNDRDEIRAGRVALQRAVDEHRDVLEGWQLEQLESMGITNKGNPRGIFLLSAALQGDLLTLWRNYGSGSEAEYAIDLDPAVPLWPVRQSEEPSHPEPSPPGWFADSLEVDDDGQEFMTYDPDQPYASGGAWGSVQYLDDTSEAAKAELESILRGLKKPIESSSGIKFTVMLSSYMSGPDPTVVFKQPGFSDEREVRATWTVSPWWRFVCYRPGRFGITPYIEVAASDHPESLEDQQNDRSIQEGHVGRLPIRSVYIGPTRTAADAEPTLRAFLDAHGYGSVRILRSSTPYR